jgi:hypothetical protein
MGIHVACARSLIKALNQGVRNRLRTYLLPVSVTSLESAAAPQRWQAVSGSAAGAKTKLGILPLHYIHGEMSSAVTDVSRGT